MYAVHDDAVRLRHDPRRSSKRLDPAVCAFLQYLFLLLVPRVYRDIPAPKLLRRDYLNLVHLGVRLRLQGTVNAFFKVYRGLRAEVANHLRVYKFDYQFTAFLGRARREVGLRLRLRCRSQRCYSRPGHRALLYVLLEKRDCRVNSVSSALNGASVLLDVVRGLKD